MRYLHVSYSLPNASRSDFLIIYSCKIYANRETCYAIKLLKFLRTQELINFKRSMIITMSHRQSSLIK